jgi:hypothetical protein
MRAGRAQSPSLKVMPSPIAHISVGYLISRHFRGRFKFGGNRLMILLFTGICLFLSMIFDLDAVVGIISGNLGGWHNQWSHSLIVCAGAIMLGTFMLLVLVRRQPRLCLTVAFACCASHILMDFFCYGRGLKLFWPLTEARFKPHVYIFMGLHWSNGLWSPWHILTAINEIIFVILLVKIIKLRQGYSGHSVN